uniref:Uncharacterized protein n=1 Tax=Picea glauca TaxID=3330 RepID=A0A117NFS6_PICGL|nr:hypothetical protein ABT39_MTgene2277 [Picea glauca]
MQAAFPSGRCPTSRPNKQSQGRLDKLYFDPRIISFTRAEAPLLNFSSTLGLRILRILVAIGASRSLAEQHTTIHACISTRVSEPCNHRYYIRNNTFTCGKPYPSKLTGTITFPRRALYPKEGKASLQALIN